MVDVDEEPPHHVNEDHLKASLALAKFLKMEIPHTLFVMRKIVTDGSACSGFQRTMIVGLEGKNSYLKTSKGKVKLEQLNLEEDSSKVLKREGKEVHYSLSRQGIPLWEIGTDASIKDPSHALEVASQLGMIFRSFKGVKRGLGSVRQDVNVSIRGGERIEIKGWQDLKTLPQLIDNEVLRQKFLIELKYELKKRKIRWEKPKDVTKHFTKTNSKIIAPKMKERAKVLALNLQGFSGLLKKEVCPGKTFGKELAEYAMAYGVKGMIHTDEDLKKYGLEEEFETLKKEMKAKKEDLVLIIVEQKETAEKAINAVLERTKYCLVGIPKETRVPNHHNATSSFARPLPGAGRMYPESDLYPIKVTKKLLKGLEKPELITEKITRIAKHYKVSPDLVRESLKEEVDLEDEFKKYKKLEAQFIASFLLNTPKEIKTRFNLDVNKLEKHNYENVLTLIEKGKIPKEAGMQVLIDIIKTGKVNLDNYKAVDDKELEKAIQDILNKNKDAPFNAIMGEAMKTFRGKVDGKKIVDIIKKLQK